MALACMPYKGRNITQTTVAQEFMWLLQKCNDLGRHSHQYCNCRTHINRHSFPYAHSDQWYELPNGMNSLCEELKQGALTKLTTSCDTNNTSTMKIASTPRRAMGVTATNDWSCRIGIITATIISWQVMRHMLLPTPLET